jgi:hypothetical protein
MRAGHWLGILAVGAVLAQGSESWAAKPREDDIDIGGSTSDGGGGSSRLILKDRSHHERPPMFSFFLNVPWWYGIGIGGGLRFTIPIVPDGFIPKLNDSFELEVGADYEYHRYSVLNYHAIIIPIEARWTFYFFPELAAYAKLGLGVEIGLGGVALPFGGGIGYGATVYHNILSPGILYKIGDSIWLRGELWYRGLKIGLGFEF